MNKLHMWVFVCLRLRKSHDWTSALKLFNPAPHKKWSITHCTPPCTLLIQCWTVEEVPFHAKMLIREARPPVRDGYPATDLDSHNLVLCVDGVPEIEGLIAFCRVVEWVKVMGQGS